MLRSRLLEHFSLLETQLQMLEAHAALLRKWNRVINLTRVEDTTLRHFGESLFLASCLPQDIVSVADIGSGGGFPGFPIAVARPEVSVTLIESDRRKASFLKELARGVANVRVLSMRADQVTEPFEWIVSRAVSWNDLKDLPARRMALLSSEQGFPGRNWDVIPLPWDSSRFVLRST